MSLTFEIAAGQRSLEGMERLSRDLKRDFIKSQANGLNRVANAARTRASRDVAQDLKIRQKRVRDSMTVTRANPSHLEARVRVSSKRLPVFEFNARQTQRGVTYRSRTGRRLIPHAFIARMPSGHTGVFKRFGSPYPLSKGRYAGQRRQGIVELRGPSIPFVFARDKIQKALRTLIDDRLDREISQSFSFFTFRRLNR